MKLKICKIPFFILSMILAVSCSNLHHLTDDKVLYTGSEIKLNPGLPAVPKQKKLASTLESKTRPRPNRKILGIRARTFLYNLAGETQKEKGLKYALRNKWGEPPVLMEQVNTINNSLILQSYLAAKGYLHSTVIGDRIENGKKGKAVYTVYTGGRYKLNEIHFQSDTVSDFSADFRETARTTLLQKDDWYDLDLFIKERERIDNLLKEAGYYYFKPDNIIIQADTTIGKGRVNLYLKAKQQLPPQTQYKYEIGHVRIFPFYSLDKDSSYYFHNSDCFEFFCLHDSLRTFKPRLFERLVFFEPDKTYTRRDHKQTLNRLMSVGTFRYVRADLTPRESGSKHLLDVDMILTPLKRNSLSFQIAGTSKSNNFLGTEAKLSYINRNLFRGAEQLIISPSGGYEQQLKSENATVRSFSIGGDIKMIFPRLLLPIVEIKGNSSYVPRTQITAAIQSISKAGYYSLNSSRGEFGYMIKGNSFNEHVINPLTLSYIHTTHISDKFNELLNSVPGLRRNYENQLILGANYTFTFNNQLNENLRVPVAFYGSVESAGGLATLFVKKGVGGTKQLFGNDLNQFLKFETDFKAYYKIVYEKVILAARINAGVAVPYGNSKTIPYARQFFGGGTNDVRAFRARSIGPGIYKAQTYTSGLFADQGGEVKFLGTLELRSRLFSIIHGAVFADAGNVWLVNPDNLRPGGEFKMDKAFGQLYAGAGAGIRIDAKIAVLRMDLAFPLYIPYLPENERNVMNDINFVSKSWRRDNLVFNLALGYPF